MSVGAVTTPSLRSRLPRWVAPILLGLLCLVVYNVNLRTIGSGDTLPARYLPLILWHDGTFNLDSNTHLVAQGRPLVGQKRPAGAAVGSYVVPPAYWMIRVGHGRASLYPVVAPLLVAPLYLPVSLFLQGDDWRQPGLDRIAQIMEKVSASLLAAIATVLMFVLLRRERNPWALPLTLVFAFGTNTWMISSQALWQHGSGEVLITLALLLTLGRASPARIGLLGSVCVLIVANRPPDAVLAGAFVIYAVWRCRRDAVWLLAGAALPLAAMLYYNLGFIGNLFGAYAEGEPRSFFHLGLLGIAGLLVSPGRGLLVFSPFLAFVPVGLIQRLRAPGTKRLAVLLGVAAVVQLVGYAQGDWRAGVSWGPRWLTDLLPILVWMLAPAPLVMRARTRGLLVALMVVAVGIQTIGAFWYTGTSDERIFAESPTSTDGAWDPGNTPFVAELAHGPAAAELACDASGSIDLPEAPSLRGGVPAALRQGAAMEGWALTCGRTPADALLLIDGKVIGGTRHFFPRPDVSRTLHTSSPTGWRVLADTRGVAPGEHTLQLAVHVALRSELRIVREQVVNVVPPPTLKDLAARAEQELRAHQAAAGYWLTSFTSDLRYMAPQPEMNTYTTSILVDLLGPISRGRGLGGAVARARRHLAAQIERGGLVRYHGLPDGPTIGRLGCVITPDSDDTALAWRIAGRGAADPRLAPMLRTLARYRDARGLYRTWLAPQDKYQCLDPGRDPDPTDLTIQMHVYLMLRELDRPAARSLCTAMRRIYDDDDVWVYYAKSPIVPYLRSAELQRAGCALPLPSARLARPVAGQEYWADVARRLVEAGGRRPDGRARELIRELLVRVGQNDFELIRTSPPLLYSNDLSAHVSRFYWSQDAGYALWLRLYAAAGGTG